MNLQQLYPPEELAQRRGRLDLFWRNDHRCRTIIVPVSNINYTNMLDRDEAREKIRLTGGRSCTIHMRADT